jgi:hypothetical protein
MSRPLDQADPDPEKIGGSNQAHGLCYDRHALHEVPQAERHQGRLKETGHGDAHGTPHAGPDAARECMGDDQCQIRTGHHRQREHCEQEDGKNGRVGHGQVQHRTSSVLTAG